MDWNQIFSETWLATFWVAFGKWIVSLIGINWVNNQVQNIGWLLPILLFTLALPLAFKLFELALSVLGFSSAGAALRAVGDGVDERITASRFNSGMSGPGRNAALSPFTDYNSDKLEEPFSPDGNQYPASMREKFEPGTVTLKPQTTADRVAMREKVAQNSTPEEMQKYDAADNGGLRNDKGVWQ